MIFADRVENLSFQESVLCAYLENCSIDIDEGNWSECYIEECLLPTICVNLGDKK